MAALKGDFVPIAVVFGLVMALAIGVHTAKQQLFHSPAVQISKKKRESIMEVEDPDYIMVDSNKFLNKSFLGKVAHIQDHDPAQTNPSRPNIYTRSVYSYLFKLYPKKLSRRNQLEQKSEVPVLVTQLPVSFHGKPNLSISLHTIVVKKFKVDSSIASSFLVCFTTSIELPLMHRSVTPILQANHKATDQSFIVGVAFKL
ncbi:hypothetical protein TEA_026549 [Camellia sinensis var. sinensis]|uniref:Uncharacterized protein n=1 Tax=Camellia sinensis var. sinensis TaxID=542762 RepID=A0A4S4D095_CAMSN|nr:hypothetical protein TEA_026549 [Camellia sinensis var. sinensis]